MSQAPASEIAESPLMYELVVVGAGPAGLSAALFAVGQRIKTVVVSAEVGGQALHSTHVENYMGFEHIGGAMLVERFEQQLRDYFIEHVSDDVSLIRRPADYFDIDLKGQGSLQSRSVIVASGMVPNTLGAPGEVEFTGRGVSYYADKLRSYGPRQECSGRGWGKLGLAGGAGSFTDRSKGDGHHTIRLDGRTGQDRRR